MARTIRTEDRRQVKAARKAEKHRRTLRRETRPTYLLPQDEALEKVSA